mmetsp:Transcript_35402/g.36068  ORF Transcript_35402/g.36068 Transcript_35402/m.36068 type:complete len:398 (+) Transcript_35402:57-1250(+)|eukprot:CAMPEP_0182418678 /NCGR_PEP_ID=MMETSP1167-20130531/3049_1 /TAXON_ID=2988 /ORGANISM="Mallomonas Sp, Strain CCMP3275" /LENGTH=397 /DNA_ID=CAMNT_0024592987 /DNA_START=45 /DNA_END=1238 /DNA_ORIENTATION=-
MNSALPPNAAQPSRRSPRESITKRTPVASLEDKGSSKGDVSKQMLMKKRLSLTPGLSNDQIAGDNTNNGKSFTDVVHRQNSNANASNASNTITTNMTMKRQNSNAENSLTLSRTNSMATKHLHQQSFSQLLTLQSNMGQGSPRRSVVSPANQGTNDSLVSPRRSLSIATRKSAAGDSLTDAMAMAIRQAQFTNQAISTAATPITAGKVSPRNSMRASFNGVGNASPRLSINRQGTASPRLSLSGMGNQSPRRTSDTSSPALPANKRGSASQIELLTQQEELKASMVQQQAEVKRLRDKARTALKIDDIESLMMKSHALAKKAQEIKFPQISAVDTDESETQLPIHTTREANMEKIRREAELAAEKAEAEWHDDVDDLDPADMSDKDKVLAALGGPSK